MPPIEVSHRRHRSSPKPRMRVALALLACVAGTLTLAGSPAPGVIVVPMAPGWPTQIGAAGDDAARAVVTTSSGDVYMSGILGAEAFVARYDKYGRQKWMHTFGNGSSDATALAVSGSRVYVGGHTTGAFSGFTNLGQNDLFVVRMDTNGSVVWVQQWGTSNDDYTNGIAVTSSAVYLTGAVYDAVLPGENKAGQFDAWVAKYDSNGVRKWVTQFGTVEHDDASSVAVSGSAVYVAGETSGSLDSQTDLALNDAYVMRFDSNGNQVWVRQFGTSGDEYGNALAVSGNGVYVAGSTLNGSFPGFTNPGGWDAWVARIKTDGTPVWTTQYGTTAEDDATGIAVKSGVVYLTGHTDGTFVGYTKAGGYDGIYVRVNTNGLFLTARQFGTAQHDYMHGIVVRSSDSYGGAVVVAGETGGLMWAQRKYGGQDAFIATLLK